MTKNGRPVRAGPSVLCIRAPKDHKNLRGGLCAGHNDEMVRLAQKEECSQGLPDISPNLRIKNCKKMRSEKKCVKKNKIPSSFCVV